MDNMTDIIPQEPPAGFKRMGGPLKYDVTVGKDKKVVIPAGTENVWIGFGLSPKCFKDPKTGKYKNMNAYFHRDESTGEVKYVVYTDKPAGRRREKFSGRGAGLFYK